MMMVKTLRLKLLFIKMTIIYEEESEGKKCSTERKAIVGILSEELRELDKLEISLSESKEPDNVITLGAFLSILCC